jgi:hypothetical protein
MNMIHTCTVHIQEWLLVKVYMKIDDGSVMLQAIFNVCGHNFPSMCVFFKSLKILFQN